MKNNPIFKIYYLNGEIFEGNALEGDWKKINDNCMISKMEYYLGNVKITMAGYKEYNHLLECVALGQQGIQKIFLMGREEDRTFIVTFDLKTKQLTKEFKPYGEEYENQILSGWKDGDYKEPKTFMEKT